MRSASAVMRVLPIPPSPENSISAPSPRLARSTASPMRPNSRARPTQGRPSPADGTGSSLAIALTRLAVASGAATSMVWIIRKASGGLTVSIATGTRLPLVRPSCASVRTHSDSTELLDQTTTMQLASSMAFSISRSKVAPAPISRSHQTE